MTAVKTVMATETGRRLAGTVEMLNGNVAGDCERGCDLNIGRILSPAVYSKDTFKPIVESTNVRQMNTS